MATITTLAYLRRKGVLAGCLGIIVAWSLPILALIIDGLSWPFALASILPASMTIQIPFWEVEKVEPETHINPLPARGSDY